MGFDRAERGLVRGFYGVGRAPVLPGNNWGEVRADSLVYKDEDEGGV